MNHWILRNLWHNTRTICIAWAHLNDLEFVVVALEKLSWPTTWQNEWNQKKLRQNLHVRVCVKFVINSSDSTTKTVYVGVSLGISCFVSIIFDIYGFHFSISPIFGNSLCLLAFNLTSFNIVASYRIFSRVVTCANGYFLEFVFLSSNWLRMFYS